MAQSTECATLALRWIPAGQDHTELWRHIPEKVDRFLTRILCNHGVVWSGPRNGSGRTLRVDFLRPRVRIRCEYSKSRSSGDHACFHSEVRQWSHERRPALPDRHPKTKIGTGSMEPLRARARNSPGAFPLF